MEFVPVVLLTSLFRISEKKRIYSQSAGQWAPWPAGLPIAFTKLSVVAEQVPVDCTACRPAMTLGRRYPLTHSHSYPPRILTYTST